MDLLALVPYVAIFVASLIGGFMVGYFLRISLRVIAFMLGFYIVVTALLYYLGVITFTINYEQAIKIAQSLIARIELPKVDWNKYGTAIVGGLLGLYFGLRGGIR